MNAAALLDSLRDRFRGEYRDGARCGFLRSSGGDREAGGYPLGFHGWPLDRRNAWFAGFNQGLSDLTRETEQAASK